MDMRGYKETLNGTVSVQKLLGARDSIITYPEPQRSWIVEDSQKRESEKSIIWQKHAVIFIGLMALSYLTMFAIPEPAIVLGAKFALEIAALIGATYMLTVLWTWDDRFWFPLLTMGLIPVRLGVGLWLVSLVIQSPLVDAEVFVYSLFFYWAMFTTIEISLVLEYSKKVKWIS